MNISIFGMGYVGAVCSACLAKQGHSIVALDINEEKLELIEAGQSPIVEEGLQDLLAAAVSEGLLSTTVDVAKAVRETDVSIICVGTPSHLNGSLNLDHVKTVCQQIGEAMRAKSERHIVVMRSTVLPGTAREITIPLLEKYSGKRVEEGFGYVSNPEFLRESTAIYDFFNPPKTVIGASDQESSDTIASLYSDLDAPLFQTDIATAEMVKYADNNWHATKIAFANEIGNIAGTLGIDGHKVMDIFCADRKLNLSPYYLKPGFAFGGSCLPKDVRALTYRARSLDLNTPLLASLMPSNREQIKRALGMIQAQGKKKIGMLGLAFKANTDDLRESPLVELAETLIGKGYQIKIYDRSVQLATLKGANRNYLLNHIPHVSSLLCDDLEAVLDRSEVLVVGNKAAEFKGIEERIGPDKAIVDLVRISHKTSSGNYQGICW